MASGHIISQQIDGKTMETVRDFILGGSKITEDGYGPHVQKQRHYFANKGPSSQDYGFSSGHVWM